MSFQAFLTSEAIYNPDDIGYILNNVALEKDLVKKSRGATYYNIPCSFDIETSSFLNDKGEKVSIMYEWTFGINGCVIIGRTWDEFINMLQIISNQLNLSTEKIFICYVHNLSYEFQFLRKHLEWDKVFSLDIRKPIYALCSLGVEFRCSYILSGYSLEKVAEHLNIFKIKKLVGDLDYNKIRHEKTPLNEKEISYCVNDVKIVMAYIYEEIERNGNITKIPLTKTGYVRNYCRKSCFYEKTEKGKKSYKYLRFMEIMQGLTLDLEEYKQLKRAFQGGFTHANPFYSGKTLENVSSDDFTSSYPTVMISEFFPMSKSELVDIKSREDFNKNLKLYCCLFDVQIIGLESRVYFDSYLSVSRCWNTKKVVVNNGRVVSADVIHTTVTEQDFFIMCRFYKWKELRVANFRRYKKAYLPTDFVKAILKLYQDKTQLKDVKGKEVEYLNSKEMLNSCYGMAVTDIVRDDIIYSDEWLTMPPDYNEVIQKYNNSRSRFLFYPWGVWVTAYARRNLFTGILEFGDDYVYSDTDSIKTLNRESHIEYINQYNEMIKRRLLKAMEYHKLSPELIHPQTVNGVEKWLGVWDYEGTYKRFKTLGAKRYMTEGYNKKQNGISITVSGLNKKICIPYICDGWGYDLEGNEINPPFEKFTNNLYVPPKYTGKNTHTYIDEERSGKVIDYLGNEQYYHEMSGVHLSQSDYSLSISQEYADYIFNVQYEG